MRISVLGLGKLGLPFAVLLASKGLHVVGVDTNHERCRRINDGDSPVAEPGLQALLTSADGRLRATHDYEDGLAGSQMTFIVVPTPSDESGAFCNSHVLEAVGRVGALLKKKADYHLVAIISTVMPGSTSGEIRVALETTAGRALGDSLGLCYAPQFIALGSVIRDLSHPDMLLIGESDPQAGDLLESVYQRMCENRPAVHRMSFVNAELAKIAVNGYITTKISYANMVAELCARLPGADSDIVTAAVGSDTRIGAKYLRGATAYGGPCFPRDNAALSALARRVGTRCDLAEATDRLNRHQVDRLVSMVRQHATSGGHVGILGMSYKADTPVVDESAGVLLAARLLDEGFHVAFYDPQALEAAAALLAGNVRAAASAADCVQGAAVVVLTTPWKEFAELPPAIFRDSGRPPVIIDCWRILPLKRFENQNTIIYLGAHSSVGNARAPLP